ncbi:hypothetical protein DFH07DRAFT_852781 [Mycena maculata]|uniref:Uncharacterized protein n=1 Tax=Mycena maculata TaxID=230809 RepID=A0AAD7HRF1_9AGAR|nr:hypothetical protein DFH07DRAFT_852781 [Mycena maculata]
MPPGLLPTPATNTVQSIDELNFALEDLRTTGDSWTSEQLLATVTKYDNNSKELGEITSKIRRNHARSVIDLDIRQRSAELLEDSTDMRKAVRATSDGIRGNHDPGAMAHGATELTEDTSDFVFPDSRPPKASMGSRLFNAGKNVVGAIRDSGRLNTKLKDLNKKEEEILSPLRARMVSPFVVQLGNDDDEAAQRQQRAAPIARQVWMVTNRGSDDGSNSSTGALQVSVPQHTVANPGTHVDLHASIVESLPPSYRTNPASLVGDLDYAVVQTEATSIIHRNPEWMRYDSMNYQQSADTVSNFCRTASQSSHLQLHSERSGSGGAGSLFTARATVVVSSSSSDSDSIRPAESIASSQAGSESRSLRTNAATVATSEMASSQAGSDAGFEARSLRTNVATIATSETRSTLM